MPAEEDQSFPRIVLPAFGRVSCGFAESWALGSTALWMWGSHVISDNVIRDITH